MNKYVILFFFLTGFAFAQPIQSTEEQILEAIDQRTRDGGAEIVKYLEKGSAFYAPAASGEIGRASCRERV